ncbi:hypothetical protein FA13DRAFT_1012523 [Coprinellus micaceus]|uniref:Secreted protein n=1 Tax=Coprinellus micaceus TaxID=71717 RepID=A0A4Y7RPQ1_COPMI|nr:hypothetical protein FA13DRAFT_1012523 [Coprinellus micaceus]
MASFGLSLLPFCCPLHPLLGPSGGCMCRRWVCRGGNFQRGGGDHMVTLKMDPASSLLMAGRTTCSLVTCRRIWLSNRYPATSSAARCSMNVECRSKLSFRLPRRIRKGRQEVYGTF